MSQKPMKRLNDDQWPQVSGRKHDDGWFRHYLIRGYWKHGLNNLLIAEDCSKATIHFPSALYSSESRYGLNQYVVKNTICAHKNIVHIVVIPEKQNKHSWS